MEIDIRNNICDPAIIRFADTDKEDKKAGTFIDKSSTDGVAVYAWNACVKIKKEDVENLIKALQKAVELGWTK